MLAVWGYLQETAVLQRQSAWCPDLMRERAQACGCCAALAGDHLQICWLPGCPSGLETPLTQPAHRNLLQKYVSLRQTRRNSLDCRKNSCGLKRSEEPSLGWSSPGRQLTWRARPERMAWSRRPAAVVGAAPDGHTLMQLLLPLQLRVPGL